MKCCVNSIKYKNTMFTQLNKIYIDDLYSILYDCKIDKTCVDITLTKKKPYYLYETHKCYIKFVMYINRENTKKIYDFMRFLVLPEISDTLLNAIEINKFVNNEKYGLFIYTSDIENNNGGPIIIFNQDINIDIVYNSKELFSSEYYF